MTDEIDPKLVERMVALVRNIAVEDCSHRNRVNDLVAAEARAIVAELPEPVDPDQAVADEIMRIGGNGLMSVEQRKTAIMVVIKRVRAGA